MALSSKRPTAKLLLAFLFLPCLGVAAQADYLPSAALVDFWASHWQTGMDEVVSDFVSRYEEELFLRLEPSYQMAARQDVSRALNAAVSWTNFSERFVNRMVERCGIDLLRTLELFAQKNDFQDLDKQTARHYASCYADVMLSARSGAIYAIMGDSTLQQILANYQASVVGTYQRIAPIVSTSSVERKYAALFSSVMTIHDIDEEDARLEARKPLIDQLQNDPAVLEVSLTDRADPRDPDFVFFYRRPEILSPKSKTCRGSSPPAQKGLIRCTWHDVGLGQDTVIRYRPSRNPDQRHLEFEVSFDYAGLVDALSN